MKMEKMLAVLDEDFEAILAASGQLDRINSGEASCSCCGRYVAVESIHMIIPLEDGSFSYVCSESSCVEQHLAA